MKLKVGVVGEGNAFYPESLAYENYFRCDERIELKSYTSYKEADTSCDVVIYYCGFIPFWRRGKSILILEYHSLSTGRLSIVKDFVKRLLNSRGDYYFFLNEKVRRGYFFYRNKSIFFYRGMGYDEKAINAAAEAEKGNKEFDFVYFGSVSRFGVKEKIVHISQLGFSLAVVGCEEKDIKYFAQYANIYPYPKLPQKAVYEIAVRARCSLNYTPDVYPLNIQDSTKVIEYCALGLPVVTNEYEWVKTFEKEVGAKFLYLHEFLDNPEVARNFEFKAGNLRPYSWFSVIDKSGIPGLLNTLWKKKVKFEGSNY